MEDVFGVIVIISFIFLVGGMIKPSWFVFWGARSRRGALIWLVVLVFALVGFGKTNITNIPDHRILSDVHTRKIKRVVEIELDKRISEDELRQIANAIHKKSPGFERTFILYSISGENSVSAWAATEFNPDLSVTILGASKEEFERLGQSVDKIDGDIFGRWISHNGYTSVITAYDAKEKTYIIERYGDGSEHENEYIKTQQDGLIRLEIDNDHGEYYLINKKGELEFWNDNGMFYTAKAM